MVRLKETKCRNLSFEKNFADRCCSEVNFDCTAAGIAMQALDPAHVSLVSLLISHDGFEHYRCERPLTLGINLESLAKILKCAGNEDSLTLRAEDDGDRLTFIFEYKSTSPFANQLFIIQAFQWTRTFFCSLDSIRKARFSPLFDVLRHHSPLEKIHWFTD